MHLKTEHNNISNTVKKYNHIIKWLWIDVQTGIMTSASSSCLHTKSQP